MRHRQVIIIGICVLAATALGGCTALLIGGAAAAGAGTVAYFEGELKATEDVPLDDAWAATKAAANDLDLAVVRSGREDTVASLVARNSADKKITIRLEAIDDQKTEIGIRVGVFGDEAYSQRILSSIRGEYDQVAGDTHEGAEAISKQVASTGTERRGPLGLP